MASQRRGGLLQLQVNGGIYDAKGAYSYNLGRPKREPVIGADGVHGFRRSSCAAPGTRGTARSARKRGTSR